MSDRSNHSDNGLHVKRQPGRTYGSPSFSLLRAVADLTCNPLLRGEDVVASQAWTTQFEQRHCRPDVPLGGMDERTLNILGSKQ